MNFIDEIAFRVSKPLDLQRLSCRGFLGTWDVCDNIDKSNTFVPELQLSKPFLGKFFHIVDRLWLLISFDEKFGVEIWSKELGFLGHRCWWSRLYDEVRCFLDESVHEPTTKQRGHEEHNLHHKIGDNLDDKHESVLFCPCSHLPNVQESISCVS